MIILFIGLAILLIIIVLLLPASIGSRLSSIAVALGVLFTGYGLYLNAKANKKQAAKEAIDRSYSYWNELFKTFLQHPNLEPIHISIYGTSIPMREHALFSMMMQTVESLIETEKNEIAPIDPSWMHSITMWVSHPLFDTFWKINKSEYTIATQQYIETLI